MNLTTLRVLVLDDGILEHLLIYYLFFNHKKQNNRFLICSIMSFLAEIRVLKVI